jgi:membrane-bound inhibitor of C-type lysozyme
VKYITTYGEGEYMRVCSQHRTLKAAHKAAKSCARYGGGKHTVWKQEGAIVDEKGKK